MIYGNYEYRVVSHSTEGYYIMQLFEKDKIYYFISKTSSSTWGNSFNNLKSNLKMFNEALEKPILLFSDIRDISLMPL